MESSFLSLPYADRQLVVLPRPAPPTNTDTEQSQRRKQLLLAGATAAAARVPFGGRILLASGVAAASRALRRPGPVHVRVITPEQAAELHLPLGHPRYQTVYVGHPASPPVYYPFADFHRRTFEHKFAEAMRLLTSLGAHRLQVSALQGWDRAFSAKIGISIPGLEPAGGHAGAGGTAVQRLLYSATLPGHGRPVMPDELVWAAHEPAWLELARQRIEHGLRTFELHVSYQDHFAVTARLAAELDGVGLEIGGELEQHKATVWAITGEFPDVEAARPGRWWYGARRRPSPDAGSTAKSDT